MSAIFGVPAIATVAVAGGAIAQSGLGDVDQSPEMMLQRTQEQRAASFARFKAQQDLAKQFRHEDMVSNAGYRFDLTAYTKRQINGTMRTDVDEYTHLVRAQDHVYKVRSRGSMSALNSMTGSAQNLTRVLHKGKETYVLGDMYRHYGWYINHGRETAVYAGAGVRYADFAENGIFYHIRQGTDIIMGGMYVNILHCPAFRFAFMVDGLHFGLFFTLNPGLRMEVALAFHLRASEFVAYNFGIHLSFAKTYVDDFMHRTEHFGVYRDDRSQKIYTTDGPTAFQETAT